MDVNNKHLEKVMYSYTTTSNQAEEENRFLKEMVNNLRNELTRFKKAPLMVCDVQEVIGENAIIKVPNGNQFYVEIAKDCEKI